MRMGLNIVSPQESRMADEVLEQIYKDQCAELSFRRDREQKIFMWSATILVAAIGGLIVSSARDTITASFGKYGRDS
jgi:hypothetical protein